MPCRYIKEYQSYLSNINIITLGVINSVCFLSFSLVYRYAATIPAVSEPLLGSVCMVRKFLNVAVPHGHTCAALQKNLCHWVMIDINGFVNFNHSDRKDKTVNKY